MSASSEKVGGTKSLGWAKEGQGRGKQGKSSPLSVEMALRNQILTVREQNLLKLGQGCVWGTVGMAGCLGSEGNKEKPEAGSMQ